MPANTNPKTKNIVLGGLLIALALVLQALRLVVPLPPLASAFVIGTLMHLMLAFTCRTVYPAALLLALLLPLFAYLQGQVLLAPLIPVIALGNALFVVLVRRSTTMWLAPLAKAAAMCAVAFVLLTFVLPQPLARTTVLVGFSVPQIVTGYAGIALAKALHKKIAQRL